MDTSKILQQGQCAKSPVPTDSCPEQRSDTRCFCNHSGSRCDRKVKYSNGGRAAGHRQCGSQRPHAHLSVPGHQPLCGSHERHKSRSVLVSTSVDVSLVAEMKSMVPEKPAAASADLWKGNTRTKPCEDGGMMGRSPTHADATENTDCPQSHRLHISRYVASISHLSFRFSVFRTCQQNLGHLADLKGWGAGT